jgi:hypothetical protein
MTAGCHFRFPNALQRTGSGSGKSCGITATVVPSFCSIGAILPSRPARSRCRRAQRLSRMARLRATAPAARSVLDGREHDGILGRGGKPIHAHQTDHQKVRVKHHQKACSRLTATLSASGESVSRQAGWGHTASPIFPNVAAGVTEQRTRRTPMADLCAVCRRGDPVSRFKSRRCHAPASKVSRSRFRPPDLAYCMREEKVRMR